MRGAGQESRSPCSRLKTIGPLVTDINRTCRILVASAPDPPLCIDAEDGVPTAAIHAVRSLHVLRHSIWLRLDLLGPSIQLPDHEQRVPGLLDLERERERLERVPVRAPAPPAAAAAAAHGAPRVQPPGDRADGWLPRWAALLLAGTPPLIAARLSDSSSGPARQGATHRREYSTGAGNGVAHAAGGGGGGRGPYARPSEPAPLSAREGAGPGTVKASSTTSEFTKRKNWSQHIIDEIQVRPARSAARSHLGRLRANAPHPSPRAHANRRTSCTSLRPTVPSCSPHRRYRTSPAGRPTR